MAFKDQSTIPKATFIEIGVCIQGTAAPSRILQHLVLISKSQFLLEKQSIAQNSFCRFKKMATQPLFQRQRNADKALFLFVLKARAIKAFLLTWSASMQIYWNKRKRLHKKRVRLPRDWFGTPIWPPWRHVKTLYPVDLGKMIQWLYLRVRIRIADRFTVTMSWCRTVASCVALTVPVAMMMMMWSKTE